jgi:hypothetical protein
MQSATQHYLVLVEEHGRKAEVAANSSERCTHRELVEIYRARLNLLSEHTPSFAQLGGEPLSMSTAINPLLTAHFRASGVDATATD